MPEIEFQFSGLIPFRHKPLLVGAMAKYYYGIGSPTKIFDFVIAPDDFALLKSHYPEDFCWVGLDQVVQIDHIRLRRTIELFDYDAICENTIEKSSFAVISIDRLYFITMVDTSNASRSSDLDQLSRRMADIPRSQPAA